MLLKHHRKGTYPMTILSQLEQFSNTIDKISLNLFNIKTFTETTKLLNPIPQNISNQLNNPLLLDLINNAANATKTLNDYLSPLNKKVKFALYKQKTNSKNKDKPYAGFKVDEMPILASPLKEEEKIIPSFDELNALHFQQTGKFIKPINRRTELSYQGTCPKCGAGNEFIYDNNNRGQYECKVCDCHFNSNTRLYKEAYFYCPHCKNKLHPHHDYANYIVYKCESDICPFYLDSLKRREQGDNSLRTITNRDKLRYHHRDFKFTLEQVSKVSMIHDTKVNINKIHHSGFVLGTILTIYVNYGLSSRKTACLLKDLFNIDICHQTVMNYAEAAASHVQYLVSNFKYDLNNVLCGDETYIKVAGKTRYVFFFSDTVSKIITSYKIYKERDTKAAVESILMSYNKYKDPPNDLLIITDGNPIYNAAQIFLKLNDVKFDLQQVIGVSNNDNISIQYRPIKQAEERLNRTYKQNYYGTFGYHSLTSANIYMVLYVCYFNFLRRHMALDYKTPVILPELSDIQLMPDKWLKLIQLSALYLN